MGEPAHNQLLDTPTVYEVDSAYLSQIALLPAGASQPTATDLQSALPQRTNPLKVMQGQKLGISHYRAHIKMNVGDDSCGLGIEPCDRNGVGHGAMVAPDAGTAFHGACWVMCEALIADEGIDSPGMRDEDPYELTRAGPANHSHAA